MTGCVLLGFGASVSTAGGRGGLHVDRHYWEIEVNSSEHRVAAEGKFTYCASATVDAITPVVFMTADTGDIHAYTYTIVGPKGAGQTPLTEKGFRGHNAELDVGARPIAFRGLTANTNTPAFVPGTYRVNVKLMSGEVDTHHHEHSASVSHKEMVHISETVTLVRRSGC